MNGRRPKASPPYQMDLVQRAIAEEKAARGQAETAASQAGAAVVYLQTLLAVVVEKAGGEITITPEEIEPFAHPEPIETVRLDGDAIVLRTRPAEELEEEPAEELEEGIGGELVKRKEELGGASFGLCPRCGHEKPLLPKVCPRSGEVRPLCPDCHLVA